PQSTDCQLAVRAALASRALDRARDVARAARAPTRAPRRAGTRADRTSSGRSARIRAPRGDRRRCTSDRPGEPRRRAALRARRRAGGRRVARSHRARTGRAHRDGATMNVVLWGLPEDGPLAAVRRELRRAGVEPLVVDQRREEQISIELITAATITGTLRLP